MEMNKKAIYVGSSVLLVAVVVAVTLCVILIPNDDGKNPSQFDIPDMAKIFLKVKMKFFKSSKF